MNEATWLLMQEILKRVTWPEALALDVGSFDINGTYRPLIEGRGWRYIGLDIQIGPNVDVMTEPFHYPFADKTFDIILSGAVMEHVTAIWNWVPELVRVLKLGGLLAIVTHWNFQEHRYPVDCWRILPDGMRYLFDLVGQLDNYIIKIANNTDIVGSAFRKWAE